MNKTAPRAGSRAVGSVRSMPLLILLAMGAWLALLPLAARCGVEDDFARAEKYVREGDVVRALPLLRKLADAGYAPAQARLGELLDKAEENDAAAALYRKAADQGNAEGAYGLGAMYASGDGVARDMQEALRWIRMAAERSYVPAVHFLAQAYLTREPALRAEPDFDAHAVQWATRAADTGFMPAMDALAAAYRTGSFGLKPDAAAAQAWQQRADAARRALASRPAPGAEQPR